MSEDNGGDLLNIATNFVTMGMVGYDKKSGKLDKGIATRAADETVGELTGRNAMREQMYKGEVRADEEEALRNKMLSDQRKQNELDDRASSNAASKIRGGAASRYNPQNFKYGDFSPDEDFLGL